MRTIYLFVDDIRKLNSKNIYNEDSPIYCTCRTYQSTIDTLQFFHQNHFSIFIDLDHDLGETYSGYDICKFIIENNISLIGFHIHSMNPVGANNMRQLLTHYGYKEF